MSRVYPRTTLWVVVALLLTVFVNVAWIPVTAAVLVLGAVGALILAVRWEQR